MARIRKAPQPDIAELFASIILEKPSFFDSEDAQDLKTLRPVERAGPGFTFDANHDPMIEKVLIIEAEADLMARGKKGYPRVVRTLARGQLWLGTYLKPLIFQDLIWLRR